MKTFDLRSTPTLAPVLVAVLLAGGCADDPNAVAGDDLAVRTDLARGGAVDLRGGGAQDLSAATDGSGRGTDGAVPVDLSMPDLAPPPPDLASPCGVCPMNYTCGTANGIPVCRAPSGIPLFGHVFVVVMENTSFSTLDGANNTPYLKGLKGTWAHATDYHGVAHPSLPNYLALASGDTQGVGCDCNPTGGACNFFNCNALLSNCGCAGAGRSIADDIEAAGLDWRAYGESMGAACNTNSAAPYATRHIPFLYFNNVVTDMKRCTTHVVDYAGFAKDLAAPSAFSFIAPNLTSDMHDPFPATAANLANGDAWLSQNMPAILASAAFTNKGLLVIVWDEDDLSGLLNKDAAVPMFVLSPLAKQAGFASAVHADHYALLATFEDGLDLPRLGNAGKATPLTDYFPNQ